MSSYPHAPHNSFFNVQPERRVENKPNVFQGLVGFQCPFNLQIPLLVYEAGEEGTSSNQAMRIPFYTVYRVQDHPVMVPEVKR